MKTRIIFSAIVFHLVVICSAMLSTASTAEEIEELYTYSSGDTKFKLFKEGKIPKDDYNMLRMISDAVWGPSTGSMSPVSKLGPVGNNIWNVNRFLDLFPYWKPYYDAYLKTYGPSSKYGPSYLTTKEFQKFLKTYNKELFPGGFLGHAGHGGVLGPEGVVGNLSPIGSSGYTHNKLGDAIDDKGKVFRTTLIESSDGKEKSYPLYEMYTSEQYVKDLSSKNDTSFAIDGTIEKIDDYDIFEFSTTDNRSLVTVQVIADHPDEYFELSIIDEAGNEIASDGRLQKDMSPVIDIEIPANKKVKAKIKRVHGKNRPFTDMISMFNPFVKRDSMRESYRFLVSHATPNANDLIDQTAVHRIPYNHKKLATNNTSTDSSPKFRSCYERIFYEVAKDFFAGKL